MKRLAVPGFMRRHSRLSRWGAAAVIAAGLLWAAAGRLTAPVHGHLTAPDAQVQSTTQAAAPAPVPGQLASSYFSLKYAGTYQLQDADPKVPAGLDYYRTLLHRSAEGSSVVNISLKPAPGGLAQDTSYTLRSEHPELYRLQTYTIGGEPVVIASRADTGEAVAFWLHGQEVATISLNEVLASPGDDAANVQALRTLLGGWQWK